MEITITKLYQLLVEKTDKNIAEALTNYIEEKIDTDIKDKTDILATKEYIANTRTEIANVRTEISKAKSEMIRWYVALSVILMLMIVGLYLKKYN